jgi:hypothetical protein
MPASRSSRAPLPQPRSRMRVSGSAARARTLAATWGCSWGVEVRGWAGVMGCRGAVIGHQILQMGRFHVSPYGRGWRAGWCGDPGQPSPVQAADPARPSSRATPAQKAACASSRTTRFDTMSTSRRESRFRNCMARDPGASATAIEPIRSGALWKTR